MATTVIMLYDVLVWLLKTYEVPIGSWAFGKAKAVSSLLEEINTGASTLEIGKDGIRRVTRIVKLRVQDPLNPARFLKEDWQILPDGRRRDRNQMPSGQIEFGEDPETAARRELMEELGLESKFRICLARTYEEVEDSRSYPGLKCCYVIHLFEVIPDEEWEMLSRDEFERNTNDGTLHFKWVVEEK